MLVPLTASSLTSVVDTTARAIASGLVLGQRYLFASSVACYLRQGTAKVITCVAKAALAEGDTVTIGSPAGLRVYEFDVAGDGVRPGNVQVNVSSDASAAQVAARLRAAIAANQPSIELADPADGTLLLVAPDVVMAVTEQVANPGFAIANAVMTVTEGSGSMYVPANAPPQVLSGTHGPQLAARRDSAAPADGRCSITRCQAV